MSADTKRRLAYEVARWEVRRHLHLRGQLWTFALICLLLGGIAALVRLAWPDGALSVTTSPVMADGLTRTARLATVVVIGCVQLFMLLGTFIGFSNLLTGITGEKRMRVTELVLSAVPARTWMDGKLLGLCLVSLVSAANVTLAGVLVLAALKLSGAALPSLGGVAQWRVVALCVPVAALGFLFWFTLFAAVAATVDDPNASNRQVALFLPFLPAALCVPVVLDPRTPLATALTLFPPTAPFVLPVRLVLTRVAPWEVVASLVLLVLATFALRNLAGRVFAAGVLMYGKDASWREVRRWVAEA